MQGLIPSTIKTLSGLGFIQKTKTSTGIYNAGIPAGR